MHTQTTSFDSCNHIDFFSLPTIVCALRMMLFGSIADITPELFFERGDQKKRDGLDRVNLHECDVV